MDYAQLFTIAVIKIDFDLQTSNLVDSFVKKYEQQLKNREESLKKGTNGCQTIVKKYTSKEKLLADSGVGKIIYVDQEYNTGSENKLVEEGDFAMLVVGVGETPKPPEQR